MQIQDILGGDKQLAQEILYDLKHDPPAAAAAATTKPAGHSHQPLSATVGSMPWQQRQYIPYVHTVGLRNS